MLVLLFFEIHDNKTIDKTPAVKGRVKNIRNLYYFVLKYQKNYKNFMVLESYRFQLSSDIGVKCIQEECLK